MNILDAFIVRLNQPCMTLQCSMFTKLARSLFSLALGSSGVEWQMFFNGNRLS